MAGIEKLDLESEDLVDDRLRQLRELVPEAFTEGGIDFDKLRLLLGDEVDEGDERYAFTWPGKADAIRQSQTSTTATLRPVVEKSRGRDGKDGSFDSDNIYIEGDNLEALKLLQRAYHSKVKMIYIDPPYNTGHDFVYKDKFGDTIENYKEQTGQANQSNPETSGRFHSDWCSMMYPRLELARELLAENGVVVISIDDNEVKNLRNLCDEVFGEGNFIASFVWQKRTSPDMRKIMAQSRILCVSHGLYASG
jgi:adenine-specific DNA-methyltransferase